jgi:YggT family protein
MALIVGLVETALTLYIIIILGRFLLSWLPLRSGTVTYRIYSFLYDASEPYLRLFRPILPLIRFGNAALDLSPVAGLAVLIVLRLILAAL